MPSSSQIGAFRDAFRTALADRAGLSGVDVFRYEPAEDDKPGAEGIWFGDARADQTPLSMGHRRIEDADMDVIVYVRRPGGGQTVAETVEGRALTLWAEIEAELVSNHTIDGAVLDAQVRSYEIENGYDHGNRITVLTGVVQIRTALAPS